MNTVIITAGGIGKRMGASVPKQFLLLQNLPVLMHTIQRFYDFDPALQLIVTLPSEHFNSWEKLCEDYRFEIKHELSVGGIERYDSIKTALSLASGDIIAVHDGVRPLVSFDTIRRCFNSCQTYGNAVPVIKISESVRQLSNDENSVIPRDTLRIIQTPQCFRQDILRQAYSIQIPSNTTDDASLVEKCGIKINLMEGNEENIKITNPFDLKIAEHILSEILATFPSAK